MATPNACCCRVLIRTLPKSIVVGTAVPARDLVEGERLAVAIGATGIIIGTTPTGHPLLIDVGDPTEMATVTIAGELALTVQVALRAAATGYQVLVCTQRPQRWPEAALRPRARRFGASPTPQGSAWTTGRRSR